MMNRPMIAGLLCITLLALTPACKTDTSPSPGLGDPYPAPMNDPQISVLAPDLQRWLGFQPATVIRDGLRPMTVEVPVRNLTDRQYLAEYRFLFYDENGRELEPAMGWTMQPLDPKQVARMKGKALSTEAQSYRLEVRWAR